LADTRTANATVAWLSTVVLLVAGASTLAHGEWLWTAFTLLAAGVVVVPPVLTRDPATTMPGELVALVALPAVFRATGAFLQVAAFVSMAGLALLVVVALDAFTSLEMNPQFAVLFVVVTTMAFAGVWSVAEFASDALLGTEFVEGQREMNWDLIAATAVGLLAGAVFEAYFREAGRVGYLQEASSARRVDGATPADEADAASASDEHDGVADSPRYRLAIRALQVVLVGIVAYSLVRLQGGLFVNSAVPLALTGLPALVRRRHDYRMHAGLALLVSLAATLHAVGALGPYQSTGWYDSVTHALSSTLVAGVGYAVAHGLDLHSDAVLFSPRFRGAFVVVFVLAVGVIWEILEFATGLATGLFGEAVLAQYGVADIVKDLVFNTVGALVVALWGTEVFQGPARAVASNVGGLLQR
jgi:uncharacterized membrane protein YjdF